MSERELELVPVAVKEESVHQGMNEITLSTTDQWYDTFKTESYWFEEPLVRLLNNLHEECQSRGPGQEEAVVQRWLGNYENRRAYLAATNGVINYLSVIEKKYLSLFADEPQLVWGLLSKNF